ncbi:hypothetical protein B0H13DRAFT_1888093 [Mycena leptocephala]|nr:hypothetical protein B0H13DRAFT_1888093 [Mycena leptocephala]
MDELKAEEPIFLQILLSLYHDPLLLTRCSCGIDERVRKAELLCPQCWLNKHQTMPTHWALIWNVKDLFFEKHDFSRVLKNASIGLGHDGQRCPEADPAQSFTLVDTNGIHATAISFCCCKTPEAPRGTPKFQQLLQAGIFPGSIKEPKTGYTLGLLEYYRQVRSQGKGSAYNFVHVLQRMADPFFAGSVPYLDILMGGGMPMGSTVLYLAKLATHTPIARPDIWVYNVRLVQKETPKLKEFEAIARAYVVPDADKEVLCKAHIGSIRHQGQVKYGNTAVSGVVACACDHTVAGSFVDMLKGEAFALGTYAQREQLKHTNSPPHEPAASMPVVCSYDSWCLFVVNLVTRVITLFPEETWLHELLASMEGQIPADHINGHGEDCQKTWQAVYFACRSHFHGETAEMIWAFLNGLGSSMRQSTGAARHDIINFVVDAWNTRKLHMAVLEDLSRQHATEVTGWSRLSRKTTKSAKGSPKSVYQHESTKGLVLTIESMLASLVAEEREKLTREDG